MNFKNRRKILSFIYRYSLRSFFLLILFNVNKSLANNCQNIGEIGTSGSCNGKLIVSRQNLLDAISDGSYAVMVQAMLVTHLLRVVLVIFIQET